MISDQHTITDSSQLTETELDAIRDYNRTVLTENYEDLFGESIYFHEFKETAGRLSILDPPPGYVIIGSKPFMIDGVPDYFKSSDLAYYDDFPEGEVRLAGDDKQCMFYSQYEGWVGEGMITLAADDIFCVLYGSFLFGYFFPDGLPNLVEEAQPVVEEDF